MITAIAPGFNVRRALAWGTTWAVSMSIVEALAISPVEAWGSVQQLLWWLMDWMVPYWCVIGALYLWVAERARRLAGVWGLLAGYLAVSLLSAFLQPPVSVAFADLMQGMFPALALYAPVHYGAESGITQPVPSNWTSIGVYHLWGTLFYGALLMAAYTLTLRAERMRHLLHQSAMARSRTQALLDDERLQALQAQIDPNLLLDSMQELEQRYRADPESAERLLEALVEFLRLAMHGLRVPVSTVSAELQLARAFAQLQRERGMAAAWRVVEDSASNTQAWKFPSLLMLPLLALGGEQGRPLLRMRAESGHIVLSLHGVANGVSAELRQQIRSRLHALYGEHFQLEPASGQNQLAIVLHSQPVVTGDHHD